MVSKNDSVDELHLPQDMRGISVSFLGRYWSYFLSQICGDHSKTKINLANKTQLKHTHIVSLWIIKDPRNKNDKSKFEYCSTRVTAEAPHKHHTSTTPRTPQRTLPPISCAVLSWRVFGKAFLAGAILPTRMGSD